MNHRARVGRDCALAASGLFVAVALSGCGGFEVGETCPGGEEVTVAGASLCVYRHPIVIETGFECPSERPYTFVGDGFTVCSDTAELPLDPFDDLLPRPGDVDVPSTEEPVPEAPGEEPPVESDEAGSADDPGGGYSGKGNYGTGNSGQGRGNFGRGVAGHGEPVEAGNGP